MIINPSGILFALLTTFSWSIGIFPFTEAARRLGVNSLNHFRLYLATCLLMVVSVVSGLDSFLQLFSAIYFHAWLWLGLSGIVGLALGDYFAFKMYAILGAKTGSVLTTFSPAAAFATGYFLLQERINIPGIFGMGLTIFGVISVSLGRTERMKIPFSIHGNVRYGITFGILAAMCQGAGLAFAKKGFLIEEEEMIALSPVHASFMRMLTSVIVLSCITIFSGKKNEVLMPILINRDSGLKYAVAGTIFGPFLGVYLSLMTITFLNVAVAQTLFSLVPLVALGIAFIFYKERITIRSLLGILIAISGVIILIWRNEIASFIQQ